MAFSKVGAGAGASTTSKNDDTSPLLREGVYDSLSAEIEQMLNKVVVDQLNFKAAILNLHSKLCSLLQLSGLNENMSELPATGTAMIHTLQRHRDILNVNIIRRSVFFLEYYHDSFCF